MYLKYGSFVHPIGEVSVQQQRNGQFVDGMSRGYVETWTIRGRYQAASQPALTTGLNAIVAAYAKQAQDIGMFQDDNTPTAMSLLSGNCLGGTRVIKPPHFPSLHGANYTTYVDYEIVVEGEVPDFSASILFFHEKVSLRGGGPRFVILECLNGPPIKQLLNQQTTFYASQVGQAVGFLFTPTAPQPIWPYAEMIDLRGRDADTPKRYGPPGFASYTEYPISWSYEFADTQPLVGSPNRWPI